MAFHGERAPSCLALPLLSRVEILKDLPGLTGDPCDMKLRVPLVMLLVSLASAGEISAQENAAPAVPATPSCSDLANDAAWGLAGNPNVTALTSVVIAATATDQAYCQVNFSDVSLAGPRYGYRTGQTSEIRVRVGLPLSSSDGGAGGVQGAWNGKVQSRGNGGLQAT